MSKKELSSSIYNRANMQRKESHICCYVSVEANERKGDAGDINNKILEKQRTSRLRCKSSNNWIIAVGP